MTAFKITPGFRVQFKSHCWEPTSHPASWVLSPQEETGSREILTLVHQCPVPLHWNSCHGLLSLKWTLWRTGSSWWRVSPRVKIPSDGRSAVTSPGLWRFPFCIVWGKLGIYLQGKENSWSRETGHFLLPIKIFQYTECGQSTGSFGKNSWCQTWQPEFDP